MVKGGLLKTPLAIGGGGREKWVHVFLIPEGLSDRRGQSFVLCCSRDPMGLCYRRVDFGWRHCLVVRPTGQENQIPGLGGLSLTRGLQAEAGQYQHSEMLFLWDFLHWTKCWTRWPINLLPTLWWVIFILMNHIFVQLFLQGPQGCTCCWENKMEEERRREKYVRLSENDWSKVTLWASYLVCTQVPQSLML